MRARLPALAWAFALCVAPVFAGCGVAPAGGAGGSSRRSGPGAEQGGDESGTVGLQLVLPSGQNIDVVEWAVSGPNGGATVVKSGQAVAKSKGLAFEVGGIPVGTGVTTSPSPGTASDGCSVTCTGSTPFDIAPGQRRPPRPSFSACRRSLHAARWSRS